MINRDEGYIYKLVSLGDTSDIGSAIECPVCGFHYNHIMNIDLLKGGNYETRTGLRGDVTIMSMLCEQGHKWELIIGFHKGETLINTRYKKYENNRGLLKIVQNNE